MKPPKNASNEDLSFSDFQMLHNNVEMQILTEIECFSVDHGP